MRLTAFVVAGDDEVDEDQVRDPREQAEVDLVVDDAQAQRLRQAGLLRRDPPQADRDQHRDAELHLRADPQRAPADDLDVVVGEAQQRAADRRPVDPDRAPVVVRQHQERDRDRREDDDPAHRRRARLDVVAGGAVLADELAELAIAQEGDELRRQEDADQQRGGAGDQDLAHQALAAAAARRPSRDDLEADAARGLDEDRVAGAHELAGERRGRGGVGDGVQLAAEALAHVRGERADRDRARRRRGRSRARRSRRGSAPRRGRARACRRARRRGARPRTRRDRRGRRASTSGWRCSSHR